MTHGLRPMTTLSRPTSSPNSGTADDAGAAAASQAETAPSAGLDTLRIESTEDTGMQNALIAHGGSGSQSGSPTNDGNNNTGSINLTTQAVDTKSSACSTTSIDTQSYRILGKLLRLLQSGPNNIYKALLRWDGGANINACINRKHFLVLYLKDIRVNASGSQAKSLWPGASVISPRILMLALQLRIAKTQSSTSSGGMPSHLPETCFFSFLPWTATAEAPGGRTGLFETGLTPCVPPVSAGRRAEADSGRA